MIENSNYVVEIGPRDIFEKDTFAYCDDIVNDDDISLIESQLGPITKATVGNNDYNLEIRNSGISWIQKNKTTEEFYRKIAASFSKINTRFFGFDLRGIYELAQYTVYKPGEYYGWHNDCGIKEIDRVPRKLSMSILINDTTEFEGGELLLKTIEDNPVVVQQKKYRAIFFPSYTLHTVAPVTKGVRKSIVVWSGGPHFR